MNFFVSGQIEDVQHIRIVMDAITATGHVITHDWTASDTMLGGREEKLKNLEETGRRAKADIDGVISADVYVLSSNNQQVGKGMYVELGAALALFETIGKPKVYIIGELHHLSVFYLHPSIIRRKDIGGVLADFR